MASPKEKLSSYLHPLVFGSATLTYQFNPDPFALQPTELIQRALDHGVRAFDTSPYYGPAEDILGDALATTYVRENFPREQYSILTKVGRIKSNSFDYSPTWIRQSVKRSCKRLKTQYLDVVYCHDVEFVSAAEVLTAVRELRRIRDEDGIVKYVGISGYPVHVLCDLAEMILEETKEPLDIVQSYANFTIQNTRLLSQGLNRLLAASVDVVTNASPLGMGLLRRNGPPIGAMGDWHPAPDGLRQVCLSASKWLEEQGDKIEKVAFRYAVENWMSEASAAGSYGYSSSKRKGVNVMGVSTLVELEESMRVWRSILDAADGGAEAGGIINRLTPDPTDSSHDWNVQRKSQVLQLATVVRQLLGTWADFTWNSPEKGFINQPQKAVAEGELKPGNGITITQVPRILTPPPSDPDNA